MRRGSQKGRRWPQCTRLDPGAALRPQTRHSFDCLDAASPSRSHSSAFLRSISRAKGSSVFSAAWRQSLAWCSHNSTCDDIAPTSCGQLMQTRTQRRSPAGCVLPMSVRRPEGRVRSKPPKWTAGDDRGVHHSLEDEHVHALRSRERGCFLVVQDTMGGKNSVNNRCRIAKHFRPK
jgi:hypothetical protein